METRKRRLFVDADYPVFFKYWNTEPLGVRNLFQKNSRTFLLVLECLYSSPDIVFDDIVAEHDNDLPAVCKKFGQGQGGRYPAFSFLIRVIDVFETEIRAVPQQSQKISSIVSSGYDQDLLDSRIDKGLDGIVNHRFRIDRKQMLIGYFGQGKEPASQASRQHHTFHKGLQRLKDVPIFVAKFITRFYRLNKG